MSVLAEEFCGIELGDKRPNRCAQRLLGQLGDKPMVSIPATCSGWT